MPSRDTDCIGVSLGRRAMLFASACVGLSFIPAAGQAMTGVAALDTPSISVKFPSKIFLDAITCAGKRLIAAGEHGVIIYSDDNGATWLQAEVPVNVELTTVMFVTPQIGWAAGHFGVVLATSNGGKTWITQLNGIQANQLTEEAAQDPAVATNPCPCAPLAMVRAGHFIAEGPDKPFLTMLVFSPLKILALGAYRMAMLTEDGGKSWVDWSLHIYDKYSHNIYGAASVGLKLYLVGEQGLIFCSVDNGNTFLPLPTASSVTLFGIIGAQDGSLVIFGVAGACFRSTDGGKSWTAVILPSQDDIPAGLVLRSGKILLISEAGALFKSADNGASYEKVSGITPMPFFALEEAANGDLVIVGAAGVSRLSRQMFNS